MNPNELLILTKLLDRLEEHIRQTGQPRKNIQDIRAVQRLVGRIEETKSVA